jgi:hypothetical protein
MLYSNAIRVRPPSMGHARRLLTCGQVHLAAGGDGLPDQRSESSASLCAARTSVRVGGEHLRLLDRRDGIDA